MAGTAATRRERLFERGVAVPGVGDASGERIANSPEPIALTAEAEGVDGLELVAPEGHQSGMVGAVWAAGPGRCRGSLGRQAAELAEDLFRVALPGPGGGAGAGGGKPAFIGGSGHTERIGACGALAQRRSPGGGACRLGKT